MSERGERLGRIEKIIESAVLTGAFDDDPDYTGVAEEVAQFAAASMAPDENAERARDLVEEAALTWAFDSDPDYRDVARAVAEIATGAMIRQGLVRGTRA